MEIKNKETDWTSYYQHKKSIFSVFTQRFTLRKILCILSGYMPEQEISILELGGANSCFVEGICRNIAVGCYDIIDNNELGVNLFDKKEMGMVPHRGLLGNLTEDPAVDRKYDFVYSVGLIEHFSDSDREKVIQSHFKFCKSNGIVMISFPTPSLKYRMVRKSMEIVGAWQFWDEQPLLLDHVKGTLEKNGIIEKVELNKKLPLTQMITVCRKSGI